MKYLHVLAISLFIALTFTQCRNKKKSSENNDTVNPTEQVNNADKKITLRDINIDEKYSWPGTTDPFSIQATRISGDSLLIDVSYGGGCEVHEFSMTSNKMWMKSNPPQLNIYLEHNSRQDKCRAMIYETLAFDLRAVRYKPEKGSVRLIINGDREKMISYDY